MKRWCVFISFVLVVMIGCDGALRVQAPELTAVIMGVNSVTVFWESSNVIEAHSDFAGFNVYVYTDSSVLMVENGEDLNKFNSQLIQDTSYQINGLLQDSIYYIQVRTVNTDSKVGEYNSTTPFLQASPRPEFAVTMHIADPGQAVNDSCAIRFSDGFVMPDSVMPDSGADMWVAMLNDTLDLESPHQHPWYGILTDRITRFSNIGIAEFDTISTVVVEPTDVSIRCMVGDLVIAKTVDSNYVKIYIESIDIQNSLVTILYAYQNVAGFPYF